MKITDEGTVTVPGVGEYGSFTLSMAKVVEACGRTDEIATINPATGQALMAYFLSAWQDTHDLVTDVVEHRAHAQDALNEAEARALLDADSKIKGRSSSELRQAVVT